MEGWGASFVPGFSQYPLIACLDAQSYVYPRQGQVQLKGGWQMESRHHRSALVTGYHGKDRLSFGDKAEAFVAPPREQVFS